MVIFTFSLMALLGKYAFRKHNPYVFIDCSIENGIAVVTGEVEDVESALTTHCIWVNKLAICLQ